LVGGHEGAGVVVGMGSLVKDWALGDHAGVKVLLIAHENAKLRLKMTTVDQRLLPAMLFLPTGRRAPLCGGSPLRLHS
jgi:hypothetical protein